MQYLAVEAASTPPPAISWTVERGWSWDAVKTQKSYSAAVPQDRHLKSVPGSHVSAFPIFL